MDRDELFATAAGIGREKAAEAIAARRESNARRALALAKLPAPMALQPRVMGAAPLAGPHAASAGFLVAAGDSWFDYPFHNILTILHDDYGYNLESAARNGDPLEAMAYMGGQIDALSRMFQKVSDQGATPKAVLLSGGGDDIAGKEFGMLLNNRNSAIRGWNDDVLKGVVEDRIAAAFIVMFNGIDSLSLAFTGHTLPILVHGYDYPVPDGRGFWGGWPLPGPWLQPGFREKNFDDLPETTALMRDAIDRFNAMLIAVADSDQFRGRVQYVDLRGTLRTDATYQDWWANELHPTKEGFEAVTAKFAAVLQDL